MSIRIDDLVPLQGCVRPGGVARYRGTVRNDGEATGVTVRTELFDLHECVQLLEAEATIPPGAGAMEIDVPVPDADEQGYWIQVALLRDGNVVAQSTTALLVVSHWRLAPRYGFLSDFGPDDADHGRTERLARFHLTVVQFYDWMYRHHTFVPPADTFEDAMGRILSLSRVRELIEGCHRRGMAALAYGAVYGAESDYVDARPEIVLTDAHGKPHALIDTFTINDIRPGSEWRERVLEQYERAVGDLGFDGIHMDQYGAPKRAYDHAGVPVDLGAEFPSLIDEAATRVAGHNADASVLFNAVNDWPVQAVADTDQAAVYIEVWPPHTRYRHLVDLVRRGRDLSGKQVILAAYLEPFRTPGLAAETSARFATAVIASAGGHHLLLGEGDGVLRDPYYPNHGRLSDTGVAIMRRYYDHTAALHRYLFGLDLVDVSLAFVGGENAELALEGAPSSPEPAAGTVWVHVTQQGAQMWVLNLVNFLGHQDDLWNAPKSPAEPRAGLRLRLGPWLKVETAVWSTPDGGSSLLELEPKTGVDGSTVLDLPEIEVWATLVILGDRG